MSENFRAHEFRWSPRPLEVRFSPDVCVVGGGAAGVAAAVGAARMGMQTVLIEKYGFCGGATVAGLSGTICGLYSSGDQHEQIVFGFADEFVSLLRQRGGVDQPIRFGRTMLLPHEPLVWKEAADQLLQDSGVILLYHTTLIDVDSEQENAVRRLVVRGPEGLYGIEPKCVVDASGDAEVVHATTQLTRFGRAGVVQSPTMVFRMGNVDMESFLSLDPQEIDAQVVLAHKSGLYDLPRHHVYAFPMPNRKEVLCNMTRICSPDGQLLSGVNGVDLTSAEIRGRQQAREYSRFLVKNISAFQDAYMVDTGVQVGIRQTRSILGKKCLENEHVLQARKWEGSVTHSAWPIEAHGTDELKIVYLENDYYDIPFETLVPSDLSNVIVAGRCLSAEHEALASARVTAQCFGMGYAAGASCALIKLEGLASGDLTGTDVSSWMKQNGMKTSKEK